MADELFIQDPDRLFEELPQPFAFINELVYSLMEIAFEKFLISENKRAELSYLNKLSNRAINNIYIPEDIAYVHITGVMLYSDGEAAECASMLVMATRTHLLYFPVSCSYEAQEPSFQYKLPVDSLIHDLNPIFSSNRYSILRCLDVNCHVEYHALTPDSSYRVCSIPDEDSYKVIATTETEPYIIMTCSEDEEVFILVYTYPVTQWRETLNTLIGSTQEEIESNLAKLTNFSKPILSAKICKPQPLQPSTFFSQNDLPALSDMKNYMNGICHTLSQEFFNNKTKEFNSKYGGTSTLINPSSIGVPLYKPHCSSVLSESIGKRNLAVWWEQGSDVYLYSISSPSKDVDVYPNSYMELAGIICSSCVNSEGDILVLGYKGCLSIWKFPHRLLIKFVTIEDSVDISPIEYLPSIGYPSCIDEFICVAGEKNYFIKVETPQDATLSLLNQSSDPNLPAVSHINQLAVSPTNNFILFSLTNGVAALRDVKADAPAIVTLLQPVDNNAYEYTCCYLSPTDRQLFFLVSDLVSNARKLVQYDLSAFIKRMIVHKMDSEPTLKPEPHIVNGCIHIPGNNTLRTLTIDFIKETYINREATKKKAQEIWDNLKSYLPPS